MGIFLIFQVQDILKIQEMETELSESESEESDGQYGLSDRSQNKEVGITYYINTSVSLPVLTIREMIGLALAKSLFQILRLLSVLKTSNQNGKKMLGINCGRAI